MATGFSHMLYQSPAQPEISITQPFPAMIVSRTFLVRQATNIASAPAYSCGLRREISRTALRVASSGRIMAESTATGTKRRPRRNQSGTLMRSSRRMNESRVPNVSKPARRMTSQRLISGLPSTRRPVRMPMKAATSSPVLKGKPNVNRPTRAAVTAAATAGLVLERGDDQGDEGQREDKTERPGLRELRADENTNRRADLPGCPQGQPGAEEVPVFVGPGHFPGCSG